MSENPTASDWATARGDRWRTQLAGMEGTLAAVDAPLLQALHLDAPYRIADIGCGGGGTSLAALRYAPAGSDVHGFDISPGLIDVARSRIPAGEKRLRFDVADMALAAPPAPYDRLLSRFGIMFFDAPQTAFTNIARWLRPGGRFAFAAWAPPAQNPWMVRAREVISRIVDIPAVDPDAPGPFRYGNAATLIQLLERAGFRGVGVEDWRGALPIGGGLSAAQAARFAVAAFANFAELLAKTDEATQRAALAALEAAYKEHERDGIVSMDACVHLFTGSSPA